MSHVHEIDSNIVIHITEQDRCLSIVSNTNSCTIDDDVIRCLLDDLLDLIHDDMSLSVSSEPLSSHSDATTVIFNPRKSTNNDDIDHRHSSLGIGMHDPMELFMDDQHSFGRSSLSASSSSSSSHSVIHAHATKLDPLSSCITEHKKPSSVPSLAFTDHSQAKRTVHSYPGSLGDCHRYLSSDMSIFDRNYSMMTTTSTVYPSGN
jgi:hypothetical protein